MILWIGLAILTAAVIAFALHPLASRDSGTVTGRDYDVEVYRDQLDEIDREHERGQLDAREAEAARNEIARRLLAAKNAAAEESAQHTAPGRRKMVAAVSLVAIPVFAVAMYLMVGAPGKPDMPHAERLARAAEAQDFGGLVARVEQHLAENPGDARGWRVLAPAYMRMGRFSQAAQAFGNALAYGEPDAELLVDYGEALTLAATGLVTEDAKTAFDNALELDARNPKARYYLGVAARQDGSEAKAADIWRELLADSPGDAPWRDVVERALASIGETDRASVALSDDQIEAVADLDDRERRAMIEGMVARLAERLASDGDDLDGWLRLARAQNVLGERQKALEALAAAVDSFHDDPDALERIDALRVALGLDS